MKANLTRLRTLFGIVASTAVGACGGGGGSSGNNYLSFTGSENGSVVLDASGVQYSVDAGHREVVQLSSNTYLTGLTVDTSGNVVDNGSIIGGVVLEPDSNGTGQVAEFRCALGGGMAISLGNAGWGTNCSSPAPSPAPAPAPAPSPAPAPTYYGALSYYQANGSQYAGSASDYTDQTSADSAANQSCDSKSGTQACGVVLDFVGQGTCGALAWSSNGAWGANFAASLSAAESSAVNECTAQGGTSCSVAIYACN